MEVQGYIFQCRINDNTNDNVDNNGNVDYYVPYCNTPYLESFLSAEETELWNEAWVPVSACYVTDVPTGGPTTSMPTGEPSANPTSGPSDKPTIGPSG